VKVLKPWTLDFAEPPVHAPTTSRHTRNDHVSVVTLQAHTEPLHEVMDFPRVAGALPLQLCIYEILYPLRSTARCLFRSNETFTFLTSTRKMNSTLTSFVLFQRLYMKEPKLTVVNNNLMCVKKRENTATCFVPSQKLIRHSHKTNQKSTFHESTWRRPTDIKDIYKRTPENCMQRSNDCVVATKLIELIGGSNTQYFPSTLCVLII
jgi:hypothetical protein